MLSFIFSLIIAGLAGWIAGNIMRDGGFGVIGNVLLGIVGGFVGRTLLWLLGFAGKGVIASLISAVLGAVVVLYLVDYLRRRA